MKHKLQKTKNYAQFERAANNREVHVKHSPKPAHRRLKASMQKYGWLPSFPMMVRVINGRFYIIDGQHRFAIAKELGLEVCFVVDDTELDIPALQSTQQPWSAEDYAGVFAAQEVADYVEAKAFCATYGIPITYGFSMLAGTIAFSNISDAFKQGSYRIKTREFAERVAKTWYEICLVSKVFKKNSVLIALWGCALVPDFDHARLIKAVTSYKKKIKYMANKKAAFEELGEIYNHGYKHKVAIAFEAEQALRNRGTVEGIAASRRKANGRAPEQIRASV